MKKISKRELRNIKKRKLNMKDNEVTETKISWKSTVDGKAFFDPNWAMDLFDNKKKREKFTPSHEMVKWFFKSVSDIDPLSLPETHKLSDGKYTIESLKIIREVLFKSDVREVKSVILFNKYKHIINNKKMLFLMLIHIYQTNSNHVDTEEFNDIAMQMSLEERLRLSTFGVNSTFTKDHNEYLNELNGEYTYVYRTFRVRKGESIRKGVTKQDNFDWTTHEEGKGCSYSLKKVRAITVASWLHKSMLKKYGQASMKDMTRFIKLNYLSDAFDSPMQLQDDVYCAVGLFKIKTENVIGATDEMSEDEVIVHSDNVELIDYKFLNILDFISQWFVWKTHQVIKTSSERSLKKTGFMNEEQFYDICYDYLSNNDEVDGDFLNNFICAYNGLPFHNQSVFYQNLLTNLFGDNSSFTIDLFEHQRKGRISFMIGLVKNDGSELIQNTNLPVSVRPRSGVLEFSHSVVC